jgi:hypothetical protein
MSDPGHYIKLTKQTATQDLQCIWKGIQKPNQHKRHFFNFLNDAWLYPVALCNLKAQKIKERKK